MLSREPAAVGGPPSRRVLGRRELLRLGRGPAVEGHWIRVHRSAMACRFEITLSGEDHAQVAAARDALDEVERIEARLTVFRETSALVDVNRRAGRGPVAVDAELFELLAQCRTLHAETEGAFDITSAPLSRCWGFLEREGRLPSPEQIAAARACVGMDGVELDAERRSVRFARPGLELNLGAIGKGHALGRIAALLRARGVERALLSAAGSSVFALGAPRASWCIDLCSRRLPGQRLARLRLHGGGLGTSGAGEQFVEVGGRRYGHVLDPRSGWPASGVLSCTVAASEPGAADALSTAFLVGGPELARRYCAAHPEVLALVTEDGSLRPRVFGGCRGATLEDA